MTRRELLRQAMMAPWAIAAARLGMAASPKLERALTRARAWCASRGVRLVTTPNQHGYFPSWVGDPSRRVAAYVVDRAGYLTNEYLLTTGEWVR